MGKKNKQPVHAQVEDLMRRWNPAPEENRMERLIGVPGEKGDGRATTAAPPDATLSHDRNPGRDDIDAQRAGSDDLEDGDDGDPIEDYADLDHAALKEEIDKRNADRDEESKISKAGSSDDLRDRLMEDDADDDEEGDDDTGDDD